MTRPQLGPFGWSCIHGEDCLEGAESWRRMSDGCDCREDAAAAVGPPPPPEADRRGRNTLASPFLPFSSLSQFPTG